MKLSKKIVILVMITLLGAFAVCGSLIIYQMWRYNIKQTTANNGRELKTMSQAFGHFVKADELERLEGTTRDAWLRFRFQKYCGRNYALLEEGDTVVNLTAYEIVAAEQLRLSADEEFDYRIQRIGNKRVLLMKHSLEKLKGFEIMQVQDITRLYDEMNEQIYIFIAIYALVSIGAGIVIFSILRHTLRPLQTLKKAADGISQGQLQMRAQVTSKDEFGTVGEAFNQMAGRIENQIEELRTLSEQRKILLGSLTHELKTPMTSIIGYSDTLLRVKVSDVQRDKALEHIHRECRRLEKLSAKMMNLLGLYENNAIHLHEQSVRELFERVEAIERYQLKAKQISFSWGCRDEKVVMDMELMESLLVNLIDNAIKASSPGGHIFLRSDEGLIQVEDQGKGIPEDEISQITQAFYMVDKSRSKGQGGIGLGLALCEQIAHLHKAVLQIDSEVGRGTVISVLFSGLIPGETYDKDEENEK